ncbi:hypothetical protein BDN67DRAFT_608143 [Paxillus ammoniavirescens]|nr:hypothetical protein BDN67DRAFT_608143 [Paxillus ammoniavirescens]
MPPVAYNPDTTPNQRWFLAEALFRALLGIDIALVNRRLEAYHASREAQQSPSCVDFADATKAYFSSAWCFDGSERQRTRFVLKLDVPVWLDVEGHEKLYSGGRFEIFWSLGYWTKRAGDSKSTCIMESNIGEIKGQRHVLSPSDSANWRARPRHDVSRTLQYIMNCNDVGGQLLRQRSRLRGEGEFGRKGNEHYRLRGTHSYILVNTTTAASLHELRSLLTYTRCIVSLPTVLYTRQP